MRCKRCGKIVLRQTDGRLACFACAREHTLAGELLRPIKTHKIHQRNVYA